jgi:hypothetical protein
MGVLRLLGGLVIMFWLIGLLFRIGGGIINLLLIVAAAIFIADAFFEHKKTM